MDNNKYTATEVFAQMMEFGIRACLRSKCPNGRAGSTPALCINLKKYLH